MGVHGDDDAHEGAEKDVGACAVWGHVHGRVGVHA